MRVKVDGVKIDGRTQAWLTIGRDGLVAIVQPFRSPRKYILTLREVVEMIAWRAAKHDVNQEEKKKR